MGTCQESKVITKWGLLAGARREGHEERQLRTRSWRPRADLGALGGTETRLGRKDEVHEVKDARVRKVGGGALLSPLCQAEEQRVSEGSLGAGKQLKGSPGRRGERS